MTKNKYNLGDRVRYKYYDGYSTMTIRIIGGPYDAEETESGIFYGRNEDELPEVAEEDIIEVISTEE